MKQNFFELIESWKEKQKIKQERVAMEHVEMELMEPSYNEKSGELEYVLFKNKRERNRRVRALSLFVVKSVSNDIRQSQNNGGDFKTILNDFGDSEVSFVSLNAYKPGENILICYGVVVEGISTTSPEQVAKKAMQYRDALQLKFETTFQNIEIQMLTVLDSWVLDGFHFEHISMTKGIPKPDESLGQRIGTTPYSPLQQAGQQIGEILLKGVTSRSTKEYAEGFPILMYAVLDKVSRDEILRSLSHVNEILSKLVSSKSVPVSESENFSIPVFFGLGFADMIGQSESNAHGLSNSEAVSNTTGQSHTQGTSTTDTTGESQQVSRGTTTSDAQQHSNTETGTKNGGLNAGFVSAGGSTSNAEQTGNTKTQGESSSSTNGMTTSQATGNSTQNGTTKSEGLTKSNGVSDVATTGTSHANNQSMSATGGTNMGDSAGIMRQQIDYYFDTTERIYSQFQYRTERALRDGMFDFRFMILTPKEEYKVMVDELIKQAYIDQESPFPVQVEQFTKEEERVLMKYARSFEKPIMKEKRIALIDKHRYSTYITTSEATAYSLPQVNLPGYISSFDPVPQSIVLPGKMEKGAVVGKQLYPSQNKKTRYDYTFQMNELGHMGVFSMTGQGKTVFLQRFLAEVHNKLGMNVLLFDWTTNHRSLVGHLKDPSRFKFSSFKPNFEKFRINLLRTPNGVPDSTWNATLSEILCYSMGLGDRSFRIIKKVLKRVKEEKRANGEEATLYHVAKGIDAEMIKRMDEYEQNRLKMPFNEQQTFASIKERISEWTEPGEIVYETLCKGPFVKIEDLVNGEYVHLIECKHLPVDVRPFVINGVTAGIFHYCSSKDIKLKKPTYLVFEEAHAVLQERTGEEPLKITETIFETINREARNYRLYIAYVCQSPELLPEIIFDNMPIRVVLQLPSIKGKEKIIAAGGKDPMRLDVDLVKYVSRLPIGTCLIRNSNMKKMQDGEFKAVCVEQMFMDDLNDEQFRQLLQKKKKTKIS